MKIKCILVDAGNVLIYKKITEVENISRELKFDSSEWNNLMKVINQDLFPEMGKQFKNINTIKKEKVYLDKLHKKMLEYFKLPLNKKMIDKLTDYRMKGNFAVHKGVIPTLKKLKKQKYKVVVLTNALPSRRYHEMKLQNLDKYLDKIFISFEMGLHKPDPRIYKRVLEKIRTKGSEVIYIDDKIPYLDGAKKAGIKNLVLCTSNDKLYTNYFKIKKFSAIVKLLKNYE